MDELKQWLSHQHAGLRTLRAFAEEASQLCARDRDHAALYFILASLVGRFVDAHEEQPLPVEVAEEAFRRLRELMTRAAQSLAAPAAEQLRALNEIASADLG